MASRLLAYSLEWWLRGQGKFEGASVSTRQIGNTDQFEIFEWRVDGVAQPTEAEITQIISDYETDILIKNNDKAVKKSAILSKLKITEDELKDLLG